MLQTPQEVVEQLVDLAENGVPDMCHTVSAQHGIERRIVEKIWGDFLDRIWSEVGDEEDV